MNNLHNTRLVVAFGVLVFCLHMCLYVLRNLQDVALPVGESMFGVIAFSFLAIYYGRNNLWSRIGQSQLTLFFCLYLAFSFAYGLWRFRTPSVAISDLWFFAFFPAILLIPPFSFNVRTFDRLIAAGVIFSICVVPLVLIAFPESLYDRRLFGSHVGPLVFVGAGSAYLLLKYAVQPNVYTLIGLAGVLMDGVVYGVGGAFRGRLILAILLVGLFIALVLTSRRAMSHVKLLTFSGAVVGLLLSGFIVATQFENQFELVTKRFTGIHDRYERSGDVTASDSRMLEIYYFRQLNPDRKLLLGHGVGALWYDLHGMYQAELAGGLEGARTMLHLNWMNLIFKIGFVGTVLLLFMIFTHFREHRGFVRRNWGWWAFLIFYCTWTTYYGDKGLGIRSIIFLFVLLQPWLFRIPLVEGGGKPGGANRPLTSRPRRVLQERRVLSGEVSR